MRRAMASPRPVPPLPRVPEPSACWNSSKTRSCWAGSIPGPVSATETTKVAAPDRGAEADLAGVGELDRVADEVEQHLAEAPLVAPAGGEVARRLHAQGQPLRAARDSVALTTACTTSRGEYASSVS